MGTGLDTGGASLPLLTLEQLRELNQQALALCKQDAPRALRLAREAHGQLSTRADATARDVFDCLRAQTYCLDVLSRPVEALPIGLEANRLAEQIGDTYLIGSIQSLLGRICWHVDDYATSLDFYQKALTLVQTGDHPDLEVSLTNGLGLVQYGLGNYPESLRYFETCLEKAGEDDLTGRADASNNIAYVLHMLGRDREALTHSLAALAMFETLGTSVGRMETLHSLGAIHAALGHDEEAMAVLRQGVDLARRNNSPLLEIPCILEISRIHSASDRSYRAEEQLLHALQIAQEVNSLTNISLIHERLVTLYKERQDYKSALEHFEAFHAAYRTTFNDRSDRRLKSLEILNQVESARRQAELNLQLARTDGLTGLTNRRHFLEIAEIAIHRVSRDQAPLSIIMLDVDHFKQVNDRYGHKAGDQILSVVAAAIKSSLRQQDVAGRYGGEEFIVLVDGLSVEQSHAIAERIRQTVAQQAIQVDTSLVSVTVSLGLAWLGPERALPLDVVMNRADHALYAAKQQGRNRVVVVEVTGAELPMG